MSPGKFGIGTFAPPLDKAGNSVRGQKAISDISDALGGNPYLLTAGLGLGPGRVDRALPPAEGGHPKPAVA